VTGLRSRRPRRFWWATWVALAVAAAAPAAAQDALPLTYAQRPIVLPRGNLVVYGGARYRLDESPTSRRAPGYLHLGVGVSLVDNFEFGATAISLSLGQKTVLLSPLLYGRYRFVNVGGVEVSAELQVTIPLDSLDGLYLGGVLPIFWHLGERTRLEFDPYVGVLIGFDRDTTTARRFGANVALLLNATRALYGGVALAADATTAERFGESQTAGVVPLSIRVGYSFGRCPRTRGMMQGAYAQCATADEAAAVDLEVVGGAPCLGTFGDAPATCGQGDFQIGLNARGYLGW